MRVSPHCRPATPRQLRSRVWPLLLGANGPAPRSEAARYAVLARTMHKDSHVVECDMARSLWSYTEGMPLATWHRPKHANDGSHHVRVVACALARQLPNWPPCPHSAAHWSAHACWLPSLPAPVPPGWTDAEREAQRAALRRVLDAAVAGNAGGVHYYQGLHDIAAVLLFVCGELPAHRLLRALAACHLRDCTRPDLAAATETLRLLYPILQQVGGCVKW